MTRPRTRIAPNDADFLFPPQIDPMDLRLPGELDFSFKYLKENAPHIVAEGLARMVRREAEWGITAHPEGAGVVFKWGGFPFMRLLGKVLEDASYAAGSYEPDAWEEAA